MECNVLFAFQMNSFQTQATSLEQTLKKEKKNNLDAYEQNHLKISQWNKLTMQLKKSVQFFTEMVMMLIMKMWK